MGLRCTVFGHKWGDADTEREREEDGDEVVTTVREVRTCSRCGAEDVLGTSKEVRSRASRDESSHRTEAAPTHDRESGDDEEHQDPEVDDGVILDEGGAAGDDRRSREWPNHPERDDEDEDDEPIPWPETAREPDDDRREERFVGADRRTGESGSAESGGPAEPDSIGADLGSVGPDPGSGDDGADAGGGEIIEAGDASEDEVIDGPGSEGAGEDGSTGVAEDAGDDEVEDTNGADDANEPGPTDEAGPADEAGAEGEADAADEGDAAVDSTGEGTRPSGPGAPRENTADGAGAEPNRRQDDGGPADEETMMGPDATRRPDDDAEVLESSGPDEGSPPAAPEPVDPTDSTDHGPTGDPASSGPDSSPSLDPTEPTGDGEPAPEDVEYYCTECDYVDDSRWPSRRAGDVCPNCRRSYLSERRY